MVRMYKESCGPLWLCSVLLVLPLDSYARAPFHRKQLVSIKNNSAPVKSQHMNYVELSTTSLECQWRILSCSVPLIFYWLFPFGHLLQTWCAISDTTVAKPSCFVPLCHYSKMTRLRRLLHLSIFRTSAWRAALFWAHPNRRLFPNVIIFHYFAFRKRVTYFVVWTLETLTSR